MIFTKQRVESKSQPYSGSKCLLKHGLPQVCLHVCMLSHVWLFEIPMDYAPQAPPSMEFSRQEYLNGLSYPSSEDLAKAGIEPTSLVSPALAGQFFTTDPTWEALPQVFSYSIGQSRWLSSRGIRHGSTYHMIITTITGSQARMINTLQSSERAKWGQYTGII